MLVTLAPEALARQVPEVGYRQGPVEDYRQVREVGFLLVPEVVFQQVPVGGFPLVPAEVCQRDRVGDYLPVRAEDYRQVRVVVSRQVLGVVCQKDLIRGEVMEKVADIEATTIDI